MIQILRLQFGHDAPKGLIHEVQLIGQARAELDESKRNQILQQAETIEYNTGGYIIPYFSNQIDAYSAKLGGFVEAKSGFPLGNYWFKNVGFTA